MADRLSLALDAGVEIPEQGTVGVFHPSAAFDLSPLPYDRLKVIQPLRPDHDAMSRLGIQAAPDISAEERFAASLVCIPRSKAQARALVAQAAGVTDGLVVVDGAKTDGVDSLIKELRRRVDLSAPIAKSHGKICWFDARDTDLSDWLTTRTEVQGFVTEPGVFSADGIDPASRMLADALPESLGSKVVDLGAGWGYLAARILERAGVEALHLVEANHAALECARANLDDPRAAFHWADARDWSLPEKVNAVVMNPPFHSSRKAEPELGLAFIDTAAKLLSLSGNLWMVANRHLPYEATLAARFQQVQEVGGDGRFKVIHARKPKAAKR